MVDFLGTLEYPITRDRNQPDTRPTAGMKPCSSRQPTSVARWFRLAVSLFPVLMLIGCQVAQSTMRVPGQAVRAITPGGISPDLDLCALQTDLQRFADEYATRTIEAFAAYAESVGTAEARHQVLRWKVAVNTDLLTIVTGPNPQANLIDLLALATLTRMSFERFGEQTDGSPALERVLEIMRTLELYAWNHLAAKAFTAAQQQELRNFLERWWEMNPSGQPIFFARPAESRSLIRPTDPGATRPGSIFALVGLDPIAGLDPAVREVTRARLLAERGLFMAQRMPFLLRWHLEMLTTDLLREQSIGEILTQTADLSESADRISRALESFSETAVELPDRITAEREAILEAITLQEGSLRELADAASQTLAEGERMSTSLNITLTTFDALMARFGVGETRTDGQPAGSNAEPFRVLDYAQTAERIEAAARQLTVLLQTLDQSLDSTNQAELSTQFGMAFAEARAGGREIVDHAFRRALLLIAAMLLAALLYRWVASRLNPATPAPNP